MGKKSSKTTNKTVYGNTTTINPYVSSQTTNKGTTTAFNKGTAYDSINNFVNSNINSLLDSYLNPSLNTEVNHSKMNTFVDNLSTQTAKNVENGIINPLSQRNMIRSSQAGDMYSSLAQANTNAVANYANELLSASKSETSDALKTLMLMYMNGYNVLSDTQKQSLQASQGNSTKTSNSTNGGSSTSDIMQLAAQVAMMFASM
jgi:hypothetical protein